jgi:hypothetical protein
MLNEITLAKGKVVSWEEFSKWSAIKQKSNLIPNNDAAYIKNQRDLKLGKKYSAESIAKRKDTRKAKGLDNGKNSLAEKTPFHAPNKNRGEFVCPYGIFRSRAIAVRAAKAAGLNNAAFKLAELTKTDPANYYFKKCK